MRYVLIPHIKVQRANALTAAWAISPAPVFACTMLAHALGCDVGIQPVAVGIIHHDAQFLAEKELPKGFGYYPHQFRAATYIDKEDYAEQKKANKSAPPLKKTPALSLQPTATMHIELSLILAFTDDCPNSREISEALTVRRIAGGLIIDFDKPVILNQLTEEHSVFSNLKSGFWLIDRSDELLNEKSGRVATLLHLINDKPEPSEAKRRFLTAATLGYTTITDFAERKNVRNNLLHAFAEPLVGLVEYKSFRQVDSQEALFWHSQWIGDDVFVVKSTSISHLTAGASV